MAVSRILIVDNRAKETSFFTELLTDMGIKSVFRSDNSIDALETLPKKKIQMAVVSLDILPTPGTVFIQQLRNMPEFKYLPLCVYSEKVSDDDIFLMQELGFDNILRPPFDREKVEGILKNILESEESLSKTEKALRKVERLIEEDTISAAIQLLTPDVVNDKEHFLRANTLAGTVYLLIDKVDRAKEFHAKVKNEDEDYSPGRHLESKILSAEGKHDEAIAILKDMVDISPKNLGTLLNLGSVFIDADKLDEAKETLDQVSELDQDNEQLKSESGKVAFKEGDMVRAKSLLSKTGQGLRLAKFFNEVAIQFVNSGDFKQGLETYDNARNLMEQSPILYKLTYNMGLAYEKSKDLEMAFKKFVEAYLQEPSFESPYKHIAKIYKERETSGVSIDPADVAKVKEAREKYKALKTAS
jgi:tetratricopeptide (TPR) repeat protein